MSKFLENAEKAAEQEATRIESEGGSGAGSPDETNSDEVIDNGGTPGEPAAGAEGNENENAGGADQGANGSQGSGGNNPDASGAAGGEAQKSTEELAEEKSALAYLKRRHPGIEADSLDDFYEKLEASNKPAAPAAPPANTEEAVTLRKEKVKERFLAGGGAEDIYTRLTTLQDIADEDLVKPAFVTTFKAANPDADDSEAEAAFAKAFFIGDEGVDFSTTEISFGAARLKEVADGIRAAEASPLSEIEGQLVAEESTAKWFGEWKGKIEAFKQNGLPKELSLPLGKHQEKDLGSFVYKLTDVQQNEVAAIMQNPQVFSELFADPKSKQTDLNALSDFIIWKKFGPQMLQAAAQNSYSEGLDTIKSTLDNRPNLTGQNGSGVLPAKEVQEGVDQLKRDAGNTFGGSAKATRKTIGS